MLKSIRPVRASGSRIELDLELLTGLAGFNRLLGRDAALEPLGAPAADVPAGDALPSLPTTATLPEYRVK